MKGRPMRRVVAWVAGAGTDTLQLECGHSAIRDHRATEPKRAPCLSCPRTDSK